MDQPGGSGNADPPWREIKASGAATNRPRIGWAWLRIGPGLDRGSIGRRGPLRSAPHLSEQQFQQPKRPHQTALPRLSPQFPGRLLKCR